MFLRSFHSVETTKGLSWGPHQPCLFRGSNVPPISHPNVGRKFTSENGRVFGGKCTGWSWEKNPSTWGFQVWCSLEHWHLEDMSWCFNVCQIVGRMCKQRKNETIGQGDPFERTKFHRGFNGDQVCEIKLQPYPFGMSNSGPITGRG